MACAGTTRRTLRWARRLILALLLLLLLLLAFGQWWLLPRLNDYREPLADAWEKRCGHRCGSGRWMRFGTVGGFGCDCGTSACAIPTAALPGGQFRPGDGEPEPVAFAAGMAAGVRPSPVGGCEPDLEQGPDGALRTAGECRFRKCHVTLEKAARWLFAVRRLDIIGKRLTVRRLDGGAINILRPYFQVRDTAEGQRLTFTAELPSGFGRPLAIECGTATRRRCRSRGWARDLSVRGRSFESGGLAVTLAVQRRPSRIGGHGDWRDWRPVRLQGQLRLRQARLKPEPRTTLLASWLAATPDSELEF